MFRRLLAAGFPGLSESQLSRLETHFNTLSYWNKKINLTRIESVEEAVRMHYVESLLLAAALPQVPINIADIGSGAGFPGYPLAVLRPDCQVTLFEAHQRKSVFLTEVSRELSNVSVIAGRAESSSWRGDWMVARAVKPADILVLPLAPRVALLMSAADLPNLPQAERVVKIPLSADRVIAMFHVEHDNINKHG